MKRIFIIAAMFLLLANTVWATGKGEAAVSDWPKKAVQIIVPFSPGGDSDFNGRAYQARLEEFLGQPVVVTNINGNNGQVGAMQVKNSAPDGYTILLWHSGMFVSKAAGATDLTLDSFEIPIVAGKDGGYAICVNGKSPYTDLKSLMDASRAAPDKLTMGIGSYGTTHVMAILLNKAGGKFKLVDVGGAADRTKALLGAHVDAIPTPLGAAVPYAKSNDYRILAVVGEERNAVYKDVPTAIESGYKGVSFTVYYFFAFPKGTPQAIVSKFAEACRKVYEKPDYRASIQETFQQSPFFMMGDEAVKFLSKQESEMMALSDALK